MDFSLSNDQIAFKSMIQAFAKDKMAPYANKWDKEKTLPIDVLREAATLGLGGIYVDEKLGGTGLGRLDAAIIFEELSTACPSTAAFISIHNMATWMVSKYGTKYHFDKYLPKLLTMEYISSYCLTEPGSGSDAAALSTSAVKEGDYYILNGTKAFISGATISDTYLTMVRTGDKSSNGISCLLIDKDSEGLSFGKLEDKMGWNSQPTAQVIFENCKVPIKNLIGKEGEGFKIAMQGLDGGRINIASCSLGAARICLEKSLDYVNDRTQFGKKIADFQATQFKLADMATQLEAARLMVLKAASEIDDLGQDSTKISAMAKRFATDIGFSICNEALQLHGGYGYLAEYQIERFVRDVRVHQILEGTNEVMRVVISRSLLANR
ncbi:MAG: acyl-CoA dehydrogenase [Pelagibacterales bacterium]|nr:acyl-CoA dehydrogenase [Pelagibacterales bacterium]MDB3955550.1 acyl-CoA dehydrogenase family protein [Alphaproteobacteria bacterium]|tara:strand:+ start:2566 stop:3708 length:1143 start_codon:yes stop_codon:yes gene_type:complete